MAQALGKRYNVDADQQISIKHQIADIDMTRLDVRRAQRTYEEILQLNAQDERAQRQLIDILLSQGNAIEGIKRLDGLLGMYAKNRQVTPILKTLEELTRLYPEEIGLRSRLAGIYRQMNRNAEAIHQLDALGELQLKSGLTQDAITTIKQLLRLGPENAQQYIEALRQLERQ
jgi:tetratricopeptide (TPR) repeat protein